MRKNAEVKLRGAALDKRIRYHKTWHDWLALPFAVGAVVLAIGDVLIFADKSNSSHWMMVALSGFCLALLGVIISVYHQKRYKALEKVRDAQTAAKTVDPKVAAAALDLLRQDAALDDDVFTPPAAIGAAVHDSPPMFGADAGPFPPGSTDSPL